MTLYNVLKNTNLNFDIEIGLDLLGKCFFIHFSIRKVKKQMYDCVIELIFNEEG